MTRKEIADSTAWAALREYIGEREAELLETLTRETQSYNDTQAIRGRIHELRDLVEWVEAQSRKRGEQHV